MADAKSVGALSVEEPARIFHGTLGSTRNQTMQGPQTLHLNLPSRGESHQSRIVEGCGPLATPTGAIAPIVAVRAERTA